MTVAEQFSVKSLGAFYVIGIEVTGSFDGLSERVPEAWRALIDRMDEIPHRAEPGVFLGIFPEADHLGARDAYTYWACVPVTDIGAVPTGMKAIALPACTYAVGTVAGEADRIAPTYVALAEWVTGEGRETDAGGYGFEWYDERRQSVLPPYERFDYDIYKPLV